MIKYFSRIPAIVSLLCMYACIQDEALNPEADILTCSLPVDIVKTEPKITNDEVMILVNKGLADLTKLAPSFTISEGATMVPASGTVRDFSGGAQEYTITSQDGDWQKTYTVTVLDEDVPSNFDFELWSGTGKYENPYEPVPLPGGGEALKMLIWSSGNSGYAIVKGQQPEDFPTCKSTDSRSGSYAAKLETKKTGFAPLPLAAGNLFLGTFDTGQAMQSPLSATRFGVPFGKKPLRLQGYYKYAPGPAYTDAAGNEIPGKSDECHIYAVFYEKGEGELLNGENVLSDYSRLIASAIVNTPPAGQYTRFDIPFDYDIPEYQCVFDPEKLAGYKYYLGMVFSSSRDGARFSGAEGSTLYVDNVTVVCEGDQ